MFTIDKQVGLLRLGHIQSYSQEDYTVDVSITTGFGAGDNIIKSQFPTSHYSSDGAFIGGIPELGTPVIIGQADGGAWYVLATFPKSHTSSTSRQLNLIPDLNTGDVVISAGYKNTGFNNNEITNKIRLDASGTIRIGNIESFTHLDTSRSLYVSNINSQSIFTEAFRDVSGIIKRDSQPNTNVSKTLRLSSLNYDDTLKEICFDPVGTKNPNNIGDSVRNPPFVERREIVYEFAHSYQVQDDKTEFESYKNSKNITIDNIFNRRESKADALSLSLVSPNYLIETIKGTVVDIYGNILDLNRSVIPVGKRDDISVAKLKDKSGSENSPSLTYKNIKDLERRSIAYHFEINSRKDILGPPDVNDDSNYSRNRSRFFFDVDKEGQVKLNIPASSESGNIPLLTRYENFTTTSAAGTDKSPNLLDFNDDNQDIFLDSFAKGVIKISDKENLSGRASPKDRFTEDNIKHGTAFHDISKVCSTFFGSLNTSQEYEPTTSAFLGRVASLNNIVPTEIITSGDMKNAGGRSAQLNLDGMLELNIGANSANRQSMWLDTAGGIVGSIGRDKNNISAGLSLDGDLFIEIGGSGITDDTRFTTAKGYNNSFRSGTLDIRVFNSKSDEVTLLRIDKEGVSVSSPMRMAFYSNGNMTFKSKSQITIDAPMVSINRRPVNKIGVTI